MTFHDALQFLNGRIDYERRTMPDAREWRLDRISKLLDQLGNPHRDYRIVHIAGTKGKGSTAHLVSAVLRSAGLRVGMHTSPHLLSICERIVIDGHPIPEAMFAGALQNMIEHINAVDQVLTPAQPGLTYFEITTAMALWCFAQSRVDWSVVEVGLGGRLDATNVVEPYVAVITNISLDHTQELGNTTASIAREKGGIIKAGRPVVSGVLDPDAQQVIRSIAAERKAPLHELSRDFHIRSFQSNEEGSTVEIETWRGKWPAITLPLHGHHQAENLAVAAAAIDVVRDVGQFAGWKPSQDILKSMSLAGRIQILRRDPLTILDVAHNVASAAALAETLATSFPAERIGMPRILVFGCSRDKDWPAMLKELTSQFDHAILTKYSSNPRALEPEEMQPITEKLNLPSTIAADAASAWRLAKNCLLAASSSSPASPQREAEINSNGLICITGSFYLAGDLLKIIGE